MDARMMQGPKVSVLIPTYNRATPLKLAVESVLRQTYADCEIIIIDDGSTDNTAAVVNHLIHGHADGTDRIRYLYQENQGKSAALNYGLSHVRGEWIAFLDSDDRWLPELLSAQLSVLQRHGPSVGVCFTDAIFTNNARLKLTAFQKAGNKLQVPTGIVGDPVRFVLASPHGIYLQTALVRTGLVSETGEFDIALRVSQDTDYLFRLALRTKFCFLTKPFVEIDRTIGRRQGLSELFEDGAIRVGERLHMYDKWLTLSAGMAKDIRDSIEMQMGGIFSEQANVYLSRGDIGRAIEAMSRSLALRPSLKAWAKWRLLHLFPGVIRAGIFARAKLSRPQSLWA